MSAGRDGDAEPIDNGEATDLFQTLIGQGLLLAVSGGPDSMAMLHLAAAVAGPLDLTLHVATVDHGLRPGSAEECRMVVASCDRLGLDCAVLAWLGEKPKTRLQEAARDARYALLTRHAAALGIGHLLTAHTLDDQAETILFRLARGSGIDGLAGMRRVVRRAGLLHARPLLAIAKARLIATCRSRGIPFIDDPSNANPRFARARSRTILPLLAAEGLDATRFAALAGRAIRAVAALEARARVVRDSVAVREGGGFRLDGVRLAAEPAEIQLRVIAGVIETVRAPDLVDGLADGRGGQSRRLIRLDRLEALCAAIHRALLDKSARSATLGGCVLRVDEQGSLIIRPAPPRRAGPSA